MSNDAHVALGKLAAAAGMLEALADPPPGSNSEGGRHVAARALVLIQEAMAVLPGVAIDLDRLRRKAGEL